MCAGWTLLHCLANETAKAQAAGLDIEVLKTLMQETVQAVHAAKKAIYDAEASRRFEQLCLHSSEPQSRHYQGQQVLKQLWADLQADLQGLEMDT